jgi:hypothetical protein
MAISTFCKTNQTIDIDEFVDYVESHIDVNEDDSIISAATMLQALANNQKILIDIFNRDLLKFNVEAGVSYSQSSSILGVGKNKSFVVRANMWPPIGPSKLNTIENALFSYELPHNHNFSFLTTNYFGPGYETDIWECVDKNFLYGRIGEEVPIRFLERTRLEPGKQMFFRRQRDIHVQLPPEDFSMSLNLLIMTEQDHLTDQFEFNTKNSSIAGFPSGTICSKRVFLMNIAGKVGDDYTADILLKIAADHPCQRTRGAALESALNLSPTTANTLDKRIKDDKSPFIQEVLKLGI